jgi:hypothetical protein
VVPFAAEDEILSASGPTLRFTEVSIHGLVWVISPRLKREGSETNH